MNSERDEARMRVGYLTTGVAIAEAMTANAAAAEPLHMGAWWLAVEMEWQARQRLRRAQAELDALL